MKTHSLALALSLAFASPAAGEFVLPDPPAGSQTEFAWWDAFTDPFTDYRLPSPGEPVPPFPDGEGNAPNRPESTNADATLIQNGPEDGTRISGTNGIYSTNPDPLEFLLLDEPAFETDSVLLQTRSLGNLPDLDSAALFFRESAGGPLRQAGEPAGKGFLQDQGDAFAMWEWDLATENVHDLFIAFAAEESSMSLQEVQLDTFDETTDFLGVALRTETTSAFTTVGDVEHHLEGESEPRASYPQGSTVEVTPVPADFDNPDFKHAFVGWTGDLSGDDAPASLEITNSPSVRAVFAPTHYDGWKINAINPFVTSPSFQTRSGIDADPDDDGLTNLMEYALGTPPEVPSDGTALPGTAIGPDGVARFTYRRQMAAADLEYRVEVSGDLETWNHNGDGSGETYTEEAGEPVFNGDGTETVTVRATQPPRSGGKRFFRLTVIRDDS